MTNAEKYKEVFGFLPDTGNCPTESCKECPCVLYDRSGSTACFGEGIYKWWNKEYKGVNNG